MSHIRARTDVVEGKIPSHDMILEPARPGGARAPSSSDEGRGDSSQRLNIPYGLADHQTASAMPPFPFRLALPLRLSPSPGAHCRVAQLPCWDPLRPATPGRRDGMGDVVIALTLALPGTAWPCPCRPYLQWWSSPPWYAAAGCLPPECSGHSPWRGMWVKVDHRICLYTCVGMV